MAVIGQKTAELCEALKINVDFIPNDYSQEGFLNQFKKDQQSILIPSSAEARPKLQHTLAQNNIVTKIDLYKPIPNDRILENHSIDRTSQSSCVNIFKFFCSKCIYKA